MTARNLAELSQRLNRLRTRKAYLEGLKGAELAALPLDRVRQVKREYARIVVLLERLERKLR